MSYSNVINAILVAHAMSTTSRSVHFNDVQPRFNVEFYSENSYSYRYACNDHRCVTSGNGSSLHRAYSSCRYSKCTSQHRNISYYESSSYTPFQSQICWELMSIIHLQSYWYLIKSDNLTSTRWWATRRQPYFREDNSDLWNNLGGHCWYRRNSYPLQVSNVRLRRKDAMFMMVCDRGTYEVRTQTMGMAMVAQPR